MAENKLFDEEVLAEELTPPESEFMPTPLESSAIQRRRRKREIVEILKMKEAKEEIRIAVDYVYAMAPQQLPSQECEDLFADFKKISEFFHSENPILEEALADLEKSLELHATTIAALDQFASKAYEKQEFKLCAAIGALFGLIKMESSRPWLLRGLALWSLKNYELAAYSFTTVIILEPNQPYSYLYLAQCLASLGDKPLAFEMAKVGEELVNPDDTFWKELAAHLTKELE